MSAERNATPPNEVRKTNYDFVPPPALVEFMAGNWIDRPSQPQAHPQAGRFAQRRTALSPEYRGTYLIVSAGRERIRANDTAYRFRTSSDFAFLAGDGEPGSVLVLEPDGAQHRSLLFVLDHNRGRPEFFADRFAGELWVGRHRGVAESRIYYGVDECRPLQALAGYLQETRDAAYPVRVLRGNDDDVDRIFKRTDGDAEFAERLSEMRLVKDDYELDELRKACALTKLGFEDAVRAMRTATSEREIEAAFWSRARIEANDVGYLTIAAAGPHACTLHWTRNTGAVSPGDLLLLDAGVECDSLYTADVTRTLPISGRFSPEQRTIYDLVWEAQRAGIAAVTPGNDFLEPNRRAARVLAQGLIDLGILKCSLDEALDPDRLLHRRYTLHGVSHMLGLDVHDCAKARDEEYRYGRLREGMVLTVEPGLYFQPDDATVPERFRGIGVRIEDDVAVTSDGSENLSAALPSQADEVERWIAGLWSEAASAKKPG
jgi:Xaa-Pro aminopeptidase